MSDSASAQQAETKLSKMFGKITSPNTSVTQDGATIENVDALKAKLSSLQQSNFILHAFQTCLDTGLLAALQDIPHSAQDLAEKTQGLDSKACIALLDVLAAEGFVVKTPDGLYSASLYSSSPPAILEPIQHQNVMEMALAKNMWSHAKSGLGGGWTYQDIDLIHAQGHASGYAIQLLPAVIFPLCPGLQDRLNDDGSLPRILDVGSGIGALACGLAQQFEKAHIVGLEPRPDSVALSRELIASKGLEQRIEIRQQLLEDFDGQHTFDFVWFPAVFFSDEALIRSMDVLSRAVKKGGWILAVYFEAPGNDTASSLSRLRNYLWGDNARGAEETIRPFLSSGAFDPDTLKTKLLGTLGISVMQKV